MINMVRLGPPEESSFSTVVVAGITLFVKPVEVLLPVLVGFAD
jgi:hypothetical protein